LFDSYIFGETEAVDCPADHDCYCADKLGLLAFGSNHGAKSFHIDMLSALPLRKIKSYGAWAAQTYSKGNTFKNFLQRETMCGASQSIFGLVDSASDHIPTQNFDYTTFENVHDDAMAYIMDPKPGWENLSDCIGFPCTAPSNVVFDMFNT
jgi:hypothetical protein